MGRFAIALVACAGCAQVFGIDETTGPGDAAPPGITATWELVTIGARVTREPADLRGQTATFLITDAAEPSGLRRVPAMLSPSNDAWSAEIDEGTRAALEYTLPGTTFRRLLAFSQRTLLLSAAIYANPVEAPMGGTLAVSLALPSQYLSSEGFQLWVVGPWVVHGLSAAELPAPDVGNTQISTSIAYDTPRFPSLVGTRPLPKITAEDQLVALRYSVGTLNGSAIIPPFEQTGGSDPVTGTMTANTLAPLDVRVDPAALVTRLNGTSPANTSIGMSWSVVAAPGWQRANNLGPVLVSAGVSTTDPGMLTTPYGNPFTSLGWNSLMTWAAGKTRAYTEPVSTLAATLGSGLLHQDEPSAGLMLDQPAGLPVLISINRQPLNSDGQAVMLDPTKAVELSLIADRTTNTYYQWNVYELVPNAAMPPTALEYKLVYLAQATETSVTIPHDVFEAGKHYTIRGHAFAGGYPAAASGDYQTRALPHAVGYLDSGVFRVMGP